MNKQIKHISTAILAIILLTPAIFVFADKSTTAAFAVVYVYALYFISRTPLGRSFIRAFKRSMIYLGIIGPEEIDDRF